MKQFGSCPQNFPNFDFLHSVVTVDMALREQEIDETVRELSPEFPTKSIFESAAADRRKSRKIAHHPSYKQDVTMWNVVGDVKRCVRAAIANNGSADEAFSVCEVQAPANVDLWRLMRQNEPMAKVVGAVDKICKLVMNYGMESITTGIYFGIYTDGQTEEPKPMIRVGTIWGDLEGVDDIADATSWEGACGVDDEAYRLPSESLVEWRRAVLRMASDISGNGLIALNYFLPMVHTGYLANSCCEELVRRKLIPEAIHARVAYGYDSGDTIELGSLTSRTFTLK